MFQQTSPLLKSVPELKGQALQEEVEQEMIKDVLLLLQGLPGNMVRPHPQNDLEHVLTSYGASRLDSGLQLTVMRLAAIGAQYKCVSVTSKFRF